MTPEEIRISYGQDKIDNAQQEDVVFFIAGILGEIAAQLSQLNASVNWALSKPILRVQVEAGEYPIRIEKQ